MNIVVIGGGIAGLGSALALSNDGHNVIVLERDATPMPASPDEAFLWQRRGAPQVRHSHALLARLRNLLRDRAPEVLAALLEAGATEIKFSENLPETLTDQSYFEGDDDLVGLACRRTTFEWVLRRAVLDLDHVEFRDGVVVNGLLTSGALSSNSRASEIPAGRETSTHSASGGAVPHVVGVRTNVGDIEADFVVDATGPRTGSPKWLAEIGAIEPEEEMLESEIVYFSRFYRLRDGHDQPDARGPIGGDLGYLKYAVFIGDNRTFSMTFAVDADDQELRSALGDVPGFDAAAAQLVAAHPWLDGRSEPITDVHVMAGLRNRYRHFVVDGRPIITGMVAIGDASVCTNPLYGRGCSLSMVHAFAFADVLGAHGDDAAAVAVALDAATKDNLEPWFRAAVQQDREAIATRDVRHAAERSLATDAGERNDGENEVDAGPSGGDYVDPKAWAREVFRDGLLPATRTSAVVFRAFLRWFNLLATPDALMNDPAVIGEALAAYQARDQREPEIPMGPGSRKEFVAQLSAH